MGRRWFRVLVVMVVLLQPFVAQTRPSGTPAATRTPASVDPQFGPRRNQEEPPDARLERQRTKAWNQERFDNLKKDTDKLLKLATELKQSVDKANKDMLSLEVIRKTEEVEKLARSVREKMKAQL